MTQAFDFPLQLSRPSLPSFQPTHACAGAAKCECGFVWPQIWGTLFEEFLKWVGRECSKVTGLFLKRSNVDYCLVTWVVSIKYTNGWLVCKKSVLKMRGIEDAPGRENSNFSDAEMSSWTFIPCKRLSTTCVVPSFCCQYCYYYCHWPEVPLQSLSEVTGSHNYFQLWKSNSHSVRGLQSYPVLKRQVQMLLWLHVGEGHREDITTGWPWPEIWTHAIRSSSPSPRPWDACSGHPSHTGSWFKDESLRE